MPNLVGTSLEDAQVELQAFATDGSVIACNDDRGNRLRPAVDSVKTVLKDGTKVGNLTTEEIYATCGGFDWYW